MLLCQLTGKWGVEPHCKKVLVFPVSSRDVTNQLSLAGQAGDGKNEKKKFTVQRPKFVFFAVVLTSEEAEPCVEDGEASKPVGDLQSKGHF